MLSNDLMNGSTTLFLVAVGALFISDGVGDGGQLPFLLMGLSLVAIGVFRIVYRLVKGKWFRIFGRNNADSWRQDQKALAIQMTVIHL